MSKLFNTDNMMDFARDAVEKSFAERVEPTPLSVTLSTSFEAAKDRTSLAIPLALDDAYGRYVADIEKATGQKLPNPYRSGATASIPTEDVVPGSQEAGSLDADIKLFHDEVATLAQSFPEMPIRTHEDIMGEVRAEREKVRQERAKAERGESGILSGAAAFAGSAAGAFTDPINIATLPVGAPLASGVIRTALIEAGIGVVSETAVQGAYQSSRSDVGEKADLKEAATDIATVGAGAAILGAGIKGLSKGAAKLRARRANLEAAEALLPR